MTKIKGYIKIGNKGEIDINSLLLLGASSKRFDESKIGYFGSGLKYAMAVLLREGISFYVFSGTKEIKIGVKKENFRGTDLNVITINGKNTSFTTDMGPDWEPWFAVREVYCNALDEEKHSLNITDKPKGQKGHTNIFIGFDDKLNKLFDNWDKYFSDKRTDLVFEDNKGLNKLFTGNSKELIVYRRGVRCHEVPIKSLFHYDLSWIEINESRTLKYTSSLTEQLPRQLAEHAPMGVIRAIYSKYKDTFEEGLQWGYAYKFNKNWLGAINGKRLVKKDISGYYEDDIRNGDCLILPNQLVSALKDYFGNEVTVLGDDNIEKGKFKQKTTEEQLKMIEEGMDFLNKVKVDVPEDVKVTVWKFVNSSQYAEINGTEIRLSDKCFIKGRHFMASTLLEEITHIKTGLGDETRALQTYLFDKIVTMYAEKEGINL